MSLSVDTRNVVEIERQIAEMFNAMFPEAAKDFIGQAFAWARTCFTGQWPGYQPIDARYHDLEHTLQGTLCMFRIVFRRHLQGVEPRCTPHGFRLGLLAILLHDTGYLKRTGDTEGTGAKYTLIHVRRSIDFAAQLLAAQGLPAVDIRAIQNMISCTGVNVDIATIPFQDELERLIGHALGTGDLLGQMAAKDYVDKLPILFEEFAEAQRYNGASVATRPTFESAVDLMRRTPSFWDPYVKNKIETEFRGIYRYLNDPFPGGPNTYLLAIEDNLRRLRERLPSAA